MKSLNKKVIWVTGASSGIGEALVYELCNEGSKLILSSRRKSELERVKNNCPEHAQNNIKVLVLDLADGDALKQKTDTAITLFGQVDILINSGGVSQRSLVRDTLVAVDRKIMEINFFGSVALSKYLLPTMLNEKSGHIVNISSLVGKFGTPYRSGYAASKHALHGFYDSMRAELWKENIKVTMVCPGFIKTDVSVNAMTENGEKSNKMDEAQAKGMAADVCARKIIKAIKKEKEEVYIGGKEVYAVLLKRFLPRIFSKMIKTAKVR